MNARLTAESALSRHFLEARGRLIEVAAILDRVERGEGWEKARHDPRLQKLHEGISALLRPGTDRAERLQMIFSLPHESI